MNWKNCFVDPDITKAETLPPEAFTSKEFLDEEIEAIFKKCWLFVPQEGLEILTKKFARVPFKMFGAPLFLQVDAADKLHCFSNICTHKWYTLVNAPEKGEKIICGQHGREFSCDGKFLSHYGFDLCADFPRNSDNLREFAVSGTAQFIFINMDSPLAPLQDFVNDMLVYYIFSLNLNPLALKRVKLKNEMRIVDGNWKQHVDNYLDNFHLTYIHSKSLAKAVLARSYTTDLYKYSAHQFVMAKDPAHGFSLKNPIFASWWFVWPNMAFNFYPWGLSVNVWMPVVGEPDKTFFFWYHYISDESKYEKRNEIWLNDKVDKEDIVAMEKVRDGALSGFATRGRFSPDYEKASHWFHRKLYEKIALE